MKKKLDSKIRRMEEDAPAESSQSENDDTIELKNHSKYNQLENSNIQDMDLGKATVFFYFIFFMKKKLLFH